MVASIFDESGELVDERERALQTICHLIEESGVEPGPRFWVDVERMQTRELHFRIRSLAEETIVKEHAKWSDLVVLALEELEDRATAEVTGRGDEILAAIDQMKTAAIRAINEGSTIDVVMNHIYGTPRKTRAAVKRDFSTLTIDEIKLLSRFRAVRPKNRDCLLRTLEGMLLDGSAPFHPAGNGRTAARKDSDSSPTKAG